MSGHRMTQLMAVVLKEVRQTLRDRRIMGLLLVSPVIQLIVFGFAVNFDVDKIPAAVVDLDRTARSRAYLNSLMADGTLRRAVDLPDAASAQALLDAGGVSVAVILPQGLDRDVTRQQTADVQVLVDGSDPNRSGVALGTTANFFGQLNEKEAESRLQALSAARGAALQLPTVRIRPRVYYNPKLQTAIFMVPGITSMLLLLVTTIVTAMGLAREREMGTLEQVLVTPIPPGIMMLGKLIPFLIVGIFDFTLAMTVGAFLFDMPLLGSFFSVFVATALYLSATLGMGLFISTVSTSQQQAFMGGILFMLPAILLSGILTPVRSMPEWLQPITYINPVRYYIEILRAVLLKDAGWADLGFQFVALGTFGLCIVTLASRRFSKQLA
ncbi:ABC transporter permease [Stigmatella aurantiaca]|uniref:Transport permease protein n=2 Tax=Stigmatella aurantiaca (strain DW4/3-1) TaxID=378806 RepID=Q096P0_STIAD|nr:ABC transporter permease [Stigmatella aurantiaca]EAU67729.1 ABC-2 [Stigmatella aurantiaca DW4/3-1]